MAEIIPIPQNKGNGAREAIKGALDTLNLDQRRGWPHCWSDWVLAELWARGFKVVPLEPNDRD